MIKPEVFPRFKKKTSTHPERENRVEVAEWSCENNMMQPEPPVKRMF
jgi:hypothetical protein